METVLMIFLIAGIGYLIGSINIKNLQLGTSAVLLVALFFGHFGVEIPAVVRNFGLALFVGSVGFMAGPVFFKNLKNKMFYFMVLGVLIISAGAATTILIGNILGLPAALSIGMFNGALTSTPGLAGALEVLKDPMISVGYGIAYPFGVLGVVLFVQLLPKLLKVNLPDEVEKLRIRLHGNDMDNKEDATNRKVIESSGLLVFCCAMTLGLLLASVTIPLPGGIKFNLGIAGGPLFTGIAVGHFNHIGNISLEVPKKTLDILRELGLMLFLLSAGTDAGHGFIEVVRQYGWQLFFAGAFVTLAPMIIATFLAIKVFKVDILSTMGAICGGMTSTPALGALITSTKTEDPSATYAATYPIALICVILASQFMALFW